MLLGWRGWGIRVGYKGDCVQFGREHKLLARGEVAISKIHVT